MIGNSAKFDVIPLLAENTRLVREHFRRQAQHLGLTQPQWRILWFVSLDPGINLSTLAEKLEVHPVTVTQGIDRLVKGGWILRERQEKDRRTCTLSLTGQAEPLLGELDLIAKQTAASALAGFKPSEIAELESLLQRMKQNLNINLQENNTGDQNGR